MFDSLTGEHHWHPQQLECLFFDRQDYRGLWWQYEAVMNNTKEAKERARKEIEELQNKKR